MKDRHTHLLAESDEQEIIQQVQEFYANFVAIDPYHFTFYVPSNYIYMLPAVIDPSALQRFSDRVVEGLAAVFLGIKMETCSISICFVRWTFDIRSARTGEFENGEEKHPIFIRVLKDQPGSILDACVGFDCGKLGLEAQAFPICTIDLLVAPLSSSKAH
ncbi:hypothetical protein KIW84_044153 [Lathyrus oleraceus]|uniref:Uncharacterized protein n=1 Tax=Pisum sativum TaxID=3888 RepID=A0A9D5ASN0_PEA|nr:hypothetical protein KIW84_044153 [Pisum sativum]